MGVWLWEGSFINSSKCGRSGNGGLFLNFLCVCFEFICWPNPYLCSLSHQAVRYLSDSSNSFPGESSSVPCRKILRNPGSIKHGRMKRSRLVTQQCFQIRNRDSEFWLELFTDGSGGTGAYRERVFYFFKLPVVRCLKFRFCFRAALKDMGSTGAGHVLLRA